MNEKRNRHWSSTTKSVNLPTNHTPFTLLHCGIIPLALKQINELRKRYQKALQDFKISITQ